MLSADSPHCPTQQFNVLCYSKWANREMGMCSKLAIRTGTDNVAVLIIIPPFFAPFSSSWSLISVHVSCETLSQNLRQHIWVNWPQIPEPTKHVIYVALANKSMILYMILFSKWCSGRRVLNRTCSLRIHADRPIVAITI